MSIWCPTTYIGTPDEHWEGPQRGGEVRTYAEGFSNHYPTTDDTHELPTHIDLAQVAPWCVPGHMSQLGRDGCWTCPTCGPHHEDGSEAGEWLRLGIYTDAAVVMDEAAVRQLRDDLDEWLARPKVRPAEDA